MTERDRLTTFCINNALSTFYLNPNITLFEIKQMLIIQKQVDFKNNHIYYQNKWLRSEFNSNTLKSIVGNDVSPIIYVSRKILGKRFIFIYLFTLPTKGESTPTVDKQFEAEKKGGIW